MKTARDYIEAISKCHQDFNKLKQIDLEFQPVYQTLSLQDKRYIAEEIFRMIDENINVFQICVKKEIQSSIR